MEKKKLLLVAVSVGVFLIIVIGLSILIFLPKNRESAETARTASQGMPDTHINPESRGSVEPERTEPATVDALDMLRNREGIQNLQPPPSASSITSSNNTGRSGTGNQTTGNNGSNLVIEVQRPSAVAIPNSDTVGRGPANQNTDPLQSPRTVTPAPSSLNRDVPPVSTTSSTPRSNSLTVTQSPVVSSSVTPPAAAKPPVQSTRSHEDYWVQAGSFSTQVRAEDVKDTLASKGITAIIENRDVKGKNVFRVRVGPYTSQNEADYWLALIKTIDGFEGSQIWQSQSQR